VANTIRIKRRSTGSPGAPASLANAELAYNEVDDVLYYGKGDSAGVATTIQAIAGSGAVVTLSGAQTISGVKTFSSTIVGSVNGNAGTATALQNSRDFSITGDITASAISFNGTGNVALSSTLANTTVSAGSYGSTTQVGTFTVDAKGRLTAAANASIAFPVSSVNGSTGVVVLTTTNIAEGTNLYYTDARVRTNRLDQMAVPTASVSFNSQKITNLLDPTAAQDAATKSYVDNVAQGLDVKASVRAATTANITLSGTQTIDGVAVVAADRVLVKNQTAASENGIYAAAAGAWSRTTDADTYNELISAFVFVEEGTVNADTGWVCTINAGGTLGTTPITFTQFSGAGQYLAGDGLTLNGNTFDVGGTAGRISVTSSAVDIAATYVGQTSITTLGTVGTGTWQGTAIAAIYGGTGQTSYAVGDILFASTTTALSKLADVATGNVLLSGGVGVAPAYGKVGLTTHVSGTLAVGNGGTGATTLTGYVQGTGTSALTASATIPNTDITGLGTMSTQAASNVAITGGSIINLTTFDGITINGGTF
jgi:hypothetical protein